MSAASVNAHFHGVLRRCPENPRYFTDDTGKAILLSGSHTWCTLVDLLPIDREPKQEEIFDFDRWLSFTKENGYNFLRLWSRDAGYRMHWRGQEDIVEVTPSIWEHAGERIPGQPPKYDLDRLNPAYFERLRKRVEQLGEIGVYVSVMLFDAWSSFPYMPGGFDGHPLNKQNNVNGVDGCPETPPVSEELNPDGDRTVFKDCDSLTIHTLADPKILAYQKAYVKKVVETLNDLDNVMFEIANEALVRSKYWQYEIIRYIRELESGMEKQHPIWMSHVVQANNPVLFASDADAVSPGVEAVDEDFCVDPPILDGRKVILADTDHLGGIWGTAQWAWKTFLRGHNPIFMDNYNMPGSDLDQMAVPDSPLTVLFGRVQYGLPDDWRVPVRNALKQILRVAKGLSLEKMLPDRTISSTKYALVSPREEYLIYQPASGQFRLNLIGARGPFTVEWIHPVTGEVTKGASFRGGCAIDFTPPYEGEVLLHLKKE